MGILPCLGFQHWGCVWYVCVVVWDSGGVKWKELIWRLVLEPWLITGGEVEARLCNVRMRWRRGSRVLQCRADPCCKGARSSGVNYSQWQREWIRFTRAAAIAGEHTKGSEYEYRSLSKWTLHSRDALSLSSSVAHALKVSTGDSTWDHIYAQIAFACVGGWSTFLKTETIYSILQNTLQELFCSDKKKSNGVQSNTDFHIYFCVA